MCLATSNNFMLVLYGAPKHILSTKSRSSGQPKNDAKTLFFHHPSPFTGNFCIVMHSVKQRLLRNWPGSDVATSRNFLRERLQKAFTRENQLH